MRERRYESFERVGENYADTPALSRSISVSTRDPSEEVLGRESTPESSTPNAPVSEGWTLVAIEQPARVTASRTPLRGPPERWWPRGARAPRAVIVEVQSPQAKPWLVRLEAFRIGVRLGPEHVTVRDEILAVLRERVDENGEFRVRDLVVRLNPDEDLRRQWAVEKALMRLCADEELAGALVRVGLGRYRVVKS